MQVAHWQQRLRSTTKGILHRVCMLADEPVELAFIAMAVVSVALVSFLFAVEQADVAVLLGGVAALVAGVIGMNARKETWIREIAPELIGISIGVIAIDRLYQVRLEQHEKRATVLQLGSLSNDFALEAVRIARERGWLFDGTMANEVFWGADLRNAMLADADLRGATMTEANLAGANLYQAKLTNTILRAANLSGARLLVVDARNADLKSADLHAVSATFSNLSGADLRGANLENAYFALADLSGATLEDANLRGANLNDATLASAYLGGADLTGASLVGANMEAAVLTGTNLAGAILTEEDGFSVQLKNAVYDDATRWPDGFPVEQLGALHVSGQMGNQQGGQPISPIGAPIQ